MVIHKNFVLVFASVIKFTNSINPKVLESRTSSCSKPDGSEISWYSCGLNNDAWYGITKQPVSVSEAQQVCSNAGGELFYTEDENSDIKRLFNFWRGDNRIITPEGGI